MISQLEHRFKIKHVIRPTDEEYITGLRIYNESTPVDIRTNTNEITFWLTKRDDSSPFEVNIFVLYLNEKVIGLSMTSYIRSTKIVIDEYLAVYDQFRINTVFLTFLSLIQNYYSENGYDVAYFLTEISNKNNGKSVDKESRISLKILCLEEFGKIDAPYYTLPLGLDNHESDFEAFLYVKSNDTISRITKQTYLSLVRSIYYDYFYPWYKEFMTKEQIGQYTSYIDKYYIMIKNALLAKKDSEVNVLNNECMVHRVGDNFEKTDGAIPLVSKKDKRILPALLSITIFSPLFLIWGYSWALDLLGIPLTSVNTTLGAVFGAIITSFITIYISRKRL